MKILIRILIGLAALVVLLSIIGLFLPSKSHIEKSIVVNAPLETVFDQVNTLKNWEKWSPWKKMDPTSVMTYSGPEAGVGAAYTWKGEKTGEGKLTIDSIAGNQYLRTQVEFGGQAPNPSIFTFAPEGNGVKVTWAMDMDYGWNIPFRYMGALFMKGMLGKQFDQGLADIKDAAEHAPVPVANGKEYKVQVVDNINITALGVSKKAANEGELGKLLGEGYGEVGQYMGKNNLKQMGAPFAIYDSYTAGGPIEFRAAIPVEGAPKGDNTVKPIKVSYAHALKVDYYGDYSGSGAAHEAIDKWAKANNRKIIGAPWEVYVTDPGMEKDTAKWLTEILYPVE